MNNWDIFQKEENVVVVYVAKWPVTKYRVKPPAAETMTLDKESII